MLFINFFQRMYESIIDNVLSRRFRVRVDVSYSYDINPSSAFANADSKSGKNANGLPVPIYFSRRIPPYINNVNH